MKDKDGNVLLSRRQVIKLGTAGGAGFFLSTKLGALPKLFAQAVPDATILDPALIPKYVNPLVIPPAMPRADKVRPGAVGKFVDYYEIAVREFSQQVLPAVNELGQSTGFGPTRVWSYCSAGAPQPLGDGGTLHYPALTIEAKYTRPSVIRWMNQLVDETGNYLPHLLPVDQTLHWANPPGPRDDHGHDPQPYKGPVPIVIHVHGAHTADHSDGYPEAWFLPAAANLPDGIATTGTHYDIFKRKSPLGLLWRPGSAVFAYPNDQRATTLWYHDHSLGMTRVNVYAGPAGFYIVRGGPGDVVVDSATGRSAELPGPAPAPGDRPGKKYLEIPLAIQDRSFKSDGSLFYPDNRAFFEGLEPNQLDIPFMGHGSMHTSDVPPIWNPEFFGHAMVVNGYTWPYLDVEQRRYRLRLLNGCDSRFLILEFSNPTVDVWQIGSDQGYLGAPFHVTDSQSTSPLNNRLLLAPAERADVIVDFTNVPAGTKVRLLNIAPDEPFGGFDPEGPVADPETTGQVMEFRVGPTVGEDTTTPPERLLLPALPAQAPMAQTRQLSLNELMSMHIKVPFDLAADAPVLLAFDPAANTLVTDDGGVFVIYDEAVHSSYIGKLVSLTPEMEAQLPAGVTAEMFGPVAAFMGTMDGDGQPVPKPWADPVTETPARDTSEVWEFHNFTADAHPIHVHLVQFQVLGREPMGDPGAARGPEGWETGMKDTVISYPGEITRIQATFDLAGRYVWHCHIVEHEDNEMMRPFRVV